MDSKEILCRDFIGDAELLETSGGTWAINWVELNTPTILKGTPCCTLR